MVNERLAFVADGVRAMLRFAIVLAGVGMAWSAFAEDMKADEARRFVVGKTFDFTCFEGTAGTGRVYSDGSVVGNIRFQGKGPVRYASLPADTLHVKGENVCGQLKGMPFRPCFTLEKKDHRTFRGSVAGFGFAYCDFTRRGGRINIAGATMPHAVAPSPQPAQPLRLRSSISAGN
ncbi:MAG: hypothetical protein AB7K04_02615 [Pseudorhodoplanes sp.]